MGNHEEIMRLQFFHFLDVLCFSLVSLVVKTSGEEPPMRIHRIVVLFVLATVLAGCRTPLYVVAEQFEKSSREYNRSLRWQEMEQACLTFSAKEIKDECLARTRGAKGVSMADYRVTSTDLDPEKGTATVRMELDYYILPSTRLQTVEDTQQWRYAEEEGAKGWRIVTPPPEFR